MLIFYDSVLLTNIKIQHNVDFQIYFFEKQEKILNFKVESCFWESMAHAPWNKVHSLNRLIKIFGQNLAWSDLQQTKYLEITVKHGNDGRKTFGVKLK